MNKYSNLFEKFFILLLLSKLSIIFIRKKKKTVPFTGWDEYAVHALLWQLPELTSLEREVNSWLGGSHIGSRIDRYAKHFFWIPGDAEYLKLGKNLHLWVGQWFQRFPRPSWRVQTMCNTLTRFRRETKKTKIKCCPNLYQLKALNYFI